MEDSTNPVHAPTPDSKHSAKRRKVTRACDRCKSRKRRCDGELPCSVCVASTFECTYDAPYTRGKAVEPAASGHVGIVDAAGDAVNSRDAEERDRQALANGSLAHEPQARSEGRDDNEAGEYTGSSSAYAFLRRAWERFGHREGLESGVREAQASEQGPIFRFGDRRVVPLHGKYGDGSNPMPTVVKGEALLSLYFDWVMPTYRFLHRPTAAKWLVELRQGRNVIDIDDVSSIRDAIVWMILATATLFDDARDSPRMEGLAEDYYSEAVAAMAEESGRPRLESVQARVAISLFLLHTGRPNEAWYNLGTTVQLSLALGLHRARAGLVSDDLVTQECRKRTFCAVATLDSYMSIMLGRPALINDNDADQQYPRLLDDDEMPGITQTGVAGDKIIQASILHCKLAKIAKQAAQGQNSREQQSDDQRRIDAASGVLRQLEQWKRSLPVILSGAVHPSSLIPIFRRQTMVLRLAYEHATMLVTRPLLLAEKTSSTLLHHYIGTCLEAANRTLEMFTGPTNESTTFVMFWFTRYVSFNAVSIVYVWLIQRKRGRLAEVRTTLSDEGLLERAEAVQRRFTEAVEMNAPSLRYGVVLRELRQELMRLSTKGETAAHASYKVPSASSITMPASSEHVVGRAGLGTGEAPGPELAQPDISFEALDVDFPLDSDLWMHLDSFPFSDINFGEWT